jgi:hypothetical protein
MGMPLQHEGVPPAASYGFDMQNSVHPTASKG